MADVKEVEWQGGIYNIADEVARGEAQQARTLANTAQTTAERALTAAGNAQNAAGAAQNTADNAQITAEAAKTAAETAQATADTAKVTADRLASLVSGTPNPIIKAKYFDLATTNYQNGMNLETFVNENLDSGYDFLSFYEVSSLGFVIEQPIGMTIAFIKEGAPYTVQTLPQQAGYSLRFYFLEIKRF